MRKEIVYFNGGWYAMLFGYITQRLLEDFVQNPILNFLLVVAVFMAFYFAGIKVCEKIWKEPTQKKNYLIVTSAQRNTLVAKAIQVAKNVKEDLTKRSKL